MFKGKFAVGNLQREAHKWKFAKGNLQKWELYKWNFGVMTCSVTTDLAAFGDGCCGAVRERSLTPVMVPEGGWGCLGCVRTVLERFRYFDRLSVLHVLRTPAPSEKSFPPFSSSARAGVLEYMEYHSLHSPRRCAPRSEPTSLVMLAISASVRASTRARMSRSRLPPPSTNVDGGGSLRS